MRTKFWLFLLCLLSLSVGISSCLGTDDEEREYSSDATIRAFALDTIYGQRYKFTIDNLRGEIYNEDSIPMSADTIIDRIRIDTLTCSGYITSGATDTVFSVEDSVDLRQPIQLKVHAVDGLTTRTYEVRVNRHQVDPDSMVWRHVGGHEVPGGVSDNLKAVARDGRVLTYVSATECYAIVASTLTVEGPLAVSGLPSDVSLTSITDFGGTLYVATASGEVYSSADGMAWTRSEALSGRVETLLGSYPANTLYGSAGTLAAIVADADGTRRFASTDGSAWQLGEAVPGTFPSGRISSTIEETANGLYRMVAVGRTAAGSGRTVPWFSFDGREWADMTSDADAACPSLGAPSIAYYGGSYYILGTPFSRLYCSLTGLYWQPTTEKALLPRDFLWKNEFYSMAVQDGKYLWLVWKDTDGQGLDIWRGHLNKQLFERQ